MPSGLGAAAGRAVLDSADEEGNCPICFEYMDPQAMTEELRTMEGCGHVFHATCIKSWFGVKRDCPLCRLQPRTSPHWGLPLAVPRIGPTTGETRTQPASVCIPSAIKKTTKRKSCEPNRLILL